MVILSTIIFHKGKFEGEWVKKIFTIGKETIDGEKNSHPVEIEIVFDKQIYYSLSR